MQLKVSATHLNLDKGSGNRSFKFVFLRCVMDYAACKMSCHRRTYRGM